MSLGIKWNKNLKWLSFWMSFPVLLIGGINITLFYFFYVISRFWNSKKLFRLSNKVVVLPILMILASITSVVISDGENISRGLAVLPNYLYWQILLITLVSARNYLNIEAIAEGLLFGLIYLLIYFNFINFGNVPLVLVGLSENTIAFIFICFSAPALIYCKNRYGLFRTYLVFAFIMYTLIVLERRSGTILTLFTVIMSLSVRSISMKTVVYSLFFSVLFAFLIRSNFTEKLIYTSSPRIHQMVYNVNDLRTQDRSYLSRLLMIEKGLTIFKSSPIYGVGLNNFRTQVVYLPGNFEGSEYVINKEELKTASSHNSYILFLAEGGLILTIPFVSLILFNAYTFVINFNNNSQYENAIYWSFLGAIIAMYFVNGILNSNTWFLIGLTTAISSIKK